jgi:hypothetical protein
MPCHLTVRTLLSTPSPVCCLLSAVCCLLSALCCLLSAVCCLLSAIAVRWLLIILINVAHQMFGTPYSSDFTVIASLAFKGVIEESRYIAPKDTGDLSVTWYVYLISQSIPSLFLRLLARLLLICRSEYCHKFRLHPSRVINSS